MEWMKTAVVFFVLVVYMILGTFLYHLIERPDMYHPHECPIHTRTDNLTTNLTASNATTNITSELSSNDCALPAFYDRVSSPTAFSFVISFLTTIGYGHITPASTAGKVMCIFYGMLGIPLMYYFLLNLGIVLYIPVFARLDRHLKTHPTLRSSDTKRLALLMTVAIVVYFVLFVMLPALVFLPIVDLPYATLLYVAFVTASTTGFGDFIPEGVIDQNDEVMMWIFQLCFFAAICLTLSYLMAVIVMLVNQLDLNASLGRPSTTTAMFRYQPQTNRSGDEEGVQRFDEGRPERFGDDEQRTDNNVSGGDGVSFDRGTLRLVDANIQEC